MTIGELCEAEGTDPPKWADLTGQCVYVCPEHRRTCFVSIDMPEDEHEHVCPLDVARSPHADNLLPADRTVWRRSSYCSGGACVEVARVPGFVLLRDGKAGDDAPVLRIPARAWGAFTQDIKAGRFTFV